MVSLSARGVGTAFVMAAKKNAECYLPSSLFFFGKAKILFGFLSVSKKRYRGWAFEKSEMVLGNLLKMGEYFI